MNQSTQQQIWFVTGSQTLYGPEVLKQVATDSKQIVKGINESHNIVLPLLYQPTVKSPDEILSLCQQANNDPNCAGLIMWMHTFSPAKMWIAGLSQLNKPWMHLHTQFNAELPWQDIDMNFMNTNQSAHGDREFGFIGTRLDLNRKVVVGHWQNPKVHQQIDDWCRAALGWGEGHQLKVARFGDNMRQVAVTEGNKVSAQIQFGYEVHAYGLGELSEVVNAVSDADINAQIELYMSEYQVDPALIANRDTRKIIANDARLELGMQSFLDDVGAKAFTNTFENLAGLTNLPGLATQRLMAKGYGYGGEGDWKTAAMTRIMKVMGQGRSGGTSFMEDYTYNFGATDQVLGAHMLEVCPSIADAKPKLEIHRHTIGCNCDVARLIFNAKAGPALNIAPVDLGNRFRLLVNQIDCVSPEHELPRLPVGRSLWQPQPSLEVAAAAWIHGGGAHHTVSSFDVNIDTLIDYAEMVNAEIAIINNATTVYTFKNELRHNSLYYRLKQGI
ncbi:L-arabinose isomerase [Celerinatantimonas yamalensis]|uniref:L-arabinose isomerase n=1 Tax=Celerinatantimonas yamalensis TaxID=559956 RepID=A0ABW9G9R7_9GAMM